MITINTRLSHMTLLILVLVKFQLITSYECKTLDYRLMKVDLVKKKINTSKGDFCHREPGAKIKSHCVQRNPALNGFSYSLCEVRVAQSVK